MHKCMIAAALAASATAVHSKPVLAKSHIRWAPYQLELQSGEKWTGELGMLDVPLLRRAPTKGHLTLRFARLPATAKADGPPIVYLAGGPGSSGIEAATGARSRLFERLRAHGDVILLDQRGTGMSDPPPECSTPWHFPAEAAATEANTNRSLEEAIRFCAAEWRRKGVAPEAYNTADNAGDVADLIRALGLRKARIIGISYGTFLGFALLRDHGALVEKAMFAGTEGPDNTIKLPTQADVVLDGLSKRLSAKDGPALIDQVERVFARLERSPVKVKLKDGTDQIVSLYDAQLATTFLMATSENAARLPRLSAAMDNGDFVPLAETIRRLRQFYGALPLMPLAMDGASPTSAARRRRVNSLVAKSIFGNTVNFPTANLAAALGIPKLPQIYVFPLRSDVPALFISGTLDSRTPPANAEEVRRGFRHSAHLVIDGGGHDNDLFFASSAIIDRIDDFLAGRSVHDEVLAAQIAR